MDRELKAVLDTNIFISILIGKGKTLSKIYEFFLDAKFTPVLSLPLYSEIIEVITRGKFKGCFKEKEEKFKELLKTDTIFVIPSSKLDISRDPKDNMVLETALEAKANFIVTGDKDLLSLKAFPISIITPKKFLEHLLMK
ncbi:MAG: putative toxin-antitoxin system toxin component, PIN family [Candidatus Omnitrophica bacterium]|nr:putative toxin-antitoxin system toxin component, PIN family [Candidatus Omnitrophota bacterium]MBU1367145.1 putative toxin-antitoxin system toxin component, PIN family [Candidatus Omnitrophota bacterium]MBU1523892.1 putative toxin-antitoxin system toxin component, PIN family [Candidatus Omnitrophota bacterium]